MSLIILVAEVSNFATIQGIPSPEKKLKKVSQRKYNLEKNENTNVSVEGNPGRHDMKITVLGQSLVNF